MLARLSQFSLIVIQLQITVCRDNKYLSILANLFNLFCKYANNVSISPLYFFLEIGLNSICTTHSQLNMA